VSFEGASAPEAGVDPSHIFVAAEQFRKAQQFLIENSPIEDTGIAAATCAAIALELYLKCLLAEADEDVPAIHDLKELFDRLPEKTRDSISANFNPYLGQAREMLERIAAHYNRKIIPVPSLTYILEVSRKAFVDLRYFHEGVRFGRGWIADGVVRAARKTILDMHREWENSRAVEPRIFKRNPDGSVPEQSF
jgi:HEPN domain-containing protein